MNIYCNKFKSFISIISSQKIYCIIYQVHNYLEFLIMINWPCHKLRKGSSLLNMKYLKQTVFKSSYNLTCCFHLRSLFHVWCLSHRPYYSCGPLGKYDPYWAAPFKLRNCGIKYDLASYSEGRGLLYNCKSQQNNAVPIFVMYE